MNPGLFRLFLATLVVIHHSFPLRMGAWAVGMFFVLSGFWISRMWRKSYSWNASPYPTFLISRWWRIAPLFVTVQLLAAGLALAGVGVGDSTVTEDWRWWITQPLVIGSTQFGRLLPPSWSLDVEMQFYLVAPAIVSGFIYYAKRIRSPQASLGAGPVDIARFATAPRIPRIGGLATLVVAMAVWCAWRLAHGSTLETPRLDVFVWLFITGVACELIDWRPPRWLVVGSVAAFLAIIAIAYAYPATRTLVWVRGADSGGESSWIIPVFFLLTTLVSLPFAISTVHHPSSRWDRWLGELSFPLYLFHWIPREWYYANVDWSAGAVHNGVLLLANFLIAFGGAVLLLQLVDRPIQKFRRGWVKRRSSDSLQSDSSDQENLATSSVRPNARS